MENLKVALVHDCLTGQRGGEKVLEVFCEIFPKAPIHTLFHFSGSQIPEVEAKKIETSFLQRLPFLKKKYRYYLLSTCIILWKAVGKNIKPKELIYNLKTRQENNDEKV